MRTITAKYSGRCAACGGEFSAGVSIRWERGAGAFHLGCDTTLAEGRSPTLADTDVAIGAARADHIRDVERFFGAEAAAAEELAWELKDPAY